MQKFIQTVYFLLLSVRKMEQWSINKAVFRLMICYLLKRKSPLTNGIQPLIAKTDINFWTSLWTPIQAIKPGAHSLKFSCVLRVLFIEKKRCGIVWQATDLMVQIQLDRWNPRAPVFQPHGGKSSEYARLTRLRRRAAPSKVPLIRCRSGLCTRSFPMPGAYPANQCPRRSPRMRKR